MTLTPKTNMCMFETRTTTTTTRSSRKFSTSKIEVKSIYSIQYQETHDHMEIFPSVTELHRIYFLQVKRHQIGHFDITTTRSPDKIK